jgi:hypothetical protein
VQVDGRQEDESSIHVSQQRKGAWWTLRRIPPRLTTKMEQHSAILALFVPCVSSYHAWKDISVINILRLSSIACDYHGVVMKIYQDLSVWISYKGWLLRLEDMFFVIFFRFS